MAVSLAYIADAQGNLTRTLVDHRGRVYLGGTWAHHDGQVIQLPKRFDRWKDVPHAWVGAVPFWV